MAPRVSPPIDPPPRSSALLYAALAGAGVLGAAALYRCSAGPEQATVAPSASTSATLVASGRCKPVIDAPMFSIGAPSPKPGAEPVAPDLDTEVEPDRDDLLAPFAVVIGRATPTPTGFAFGALGESEGGSAAFLVTLGADGTGGAAKKIFRSRADLDPPVVAAAPGDGGLFVAALEPNASGRAIRLVRFSGDDVTWGAEIDEGRDESLAIDLAVTERRGVVVWDAADDDRSIVHVAGFTLDKVGEVVSRRPATAKELDADSPRVVAAERGFYLAYLVHGAQSRRELVGRRTPDGGDKPAPTATSSAPKPKKKPKKQDEPEPEEVDESRGGEAISASWIEVVPLDETGAQSSEALRVTPEGVTVIAFDMAPGPDGSLVVVYRDDDAPTGGGGGIVRMVNLRAGGLGASYESEDPLPSDGVPSVLGGWLAVPTLAGPDLLARLGKDGLPAELLSREPSLGRGEPIAATGSRLLLAEPQGAAMGFRVVECSEQGSPPAPPPIPSASPP